MKLYQIPKFDEKQKAVFTSDLSKDNEYLTETAGFVPLEVKLKQFEQNGLAAQFNTSEFTSNDLRDIYLNPDFDITPDDEFEEVEEKIAARNAYIQEIRKAKSDGVNEPPAAAKAGTEEPKNVENLQNEAE